LYPASANAIATGGVDAELKHLTAEGARAIAIELGVACGGRAGDEKVIGLNGDATAIELGGIGHRSPHYSSVVAKDNAIRDS
jgi:hypothetical protein